MNDFFKEISMQSLGTRDQLNLTQRAASFFGDNSFDLSLNKIDYKEPGYQDHFKRSQEAIVRAVDGLKQTALILGAGEMNDIPLKTIAEQFDCVILVDIDTKYTAFALERIPKDLQTKCTLLQRDLTGVFLEFSALVEEIAEAKPSYDEFVAKVLDALPTFKRKGLDLQGIRPSFISSSLLCSQLAGSFANYLDELSSEFYRKPFKVPAEREAAFDRWLTKVQVDHLDDLHRLLDETGKVYFAEHFSAKGVVLLKSRIEERTEDLGESPYPGSSEVKAHLEKRFETVRREAWTWSLFVNKSTGTASIEEDDGSMTQVPVDVTETRECQITALTLKKK